MSKREPRNLRLLILDDQVPSSNSLAESFKKRYLDLVSVVVPRALSSYRGPGVKTWAQLLAGLRAAATRLDHPLRTWDLLLADVLFFADETAPRYPEEYSGDEEACPNGFGLIHALALLACRGRNGQPFGWTLRSANAGAVSVDPVAMTTYGLLAALDGDTFGTVPNAPKPYLTDRLSELPRTAITVGAWERALESYRARLLSGADTSWLTVELQGEPETWRQVFKRNGDARALADEGLIVRCGVDEQFIRLPSLFADYIDEAGGFASRSRGVSQESELDTFLATLEPCLWPRAADLASAWRTAKDLNDQGQDDVLANTSERVKVAVLTLMWLYRRHHPEFSYSQGKSGTKDVFSKLNIDTVKADAKYARLNAACAKILGMTPAALIKHLDQGRWPGNQIPALREAALLLAHEWQIQLPLPFSTTKDEACE